MEQDTARKVALPVSFTSLLTIVFLAITALAGAYVWGVMSGRQDNEPAKAVVAAAQTQPARPELSEPDPKILKARELEFAHVLKGEARPAPRPVPSKGPDERSETKKADAAVAQANVGGQGAGQTDAGESAPGQMHDYVFQLVALKDEQAVDNIRQRLEGHGIRTRLERSGKLYVVLALLRGDAQRAAEIVQMAKELRLGEPLVRSKRPVSP